MTKADIIARIAQDTGIEKSVATTVVEAFMESVRETKESKGKRKERKNPAANRRRRKRLVTFQRTRLS